jgi:hypothetical protein
LHEVVQSKFAEAQSRHGRFLASDRGPKPLARYLGNLFGHVLDFSDLAQVAPIVIDERTFPIGDAALVEAWRVARDIYRDVMGASYPSETFRVLKNNDMDRYGAYRTRRLVLEAWDRES